MRNLLVHELRRRTGAILGWGAGLALFAALYVRIYPEVEDLLAEGAAHFSIYRVIGMDMASFEGFFASTVVQFIPLILGIYAIMDGTDALAGEEDRGVLEVIAAMPLSRRGIVTAKFLSLGTALAAVLLLAASGGAAMSAFTGGIAGVGAGDVFLASLTPWPLVLLFAALSLCLGALLPSRRTAAMAVTLLFVGSYFGERMAVLLDAPGPIHHLFPFHWFDASAAVFREGLGAGRPSTLLGLTAILFGVTLLAFDRRDLTVGRWPWE